MTAYTITVNGKSYSVSVSAGAQQAVAAAQPKAPSQPVAVQGGSAEPLNAPLAGTIWKINAKQGQPVSEGDVVLILEAMKMETEIRASKSGTIQQININEGDSVEVGETLLTIA